MRGQGEGREGHESEGPRGSSSHCLLPLLAPRAPRARTRDPGGRLRLFARHPRHEDRTPAHLATHWTAAPAKPARRRRPDKGVADRHRSCSRRGAAVTACRRDGPSMKTFLGEPARATAWWTAACAALIAACGSGASTPTMADADGSTGCAAGETYCTGCGGGGFCSHGCPGFQCPAVAGDGGAVGDAGLEGGACPSSAPVPCLDCAGGTFCVATACPLTTCPAPEAGSDAAAIGDGALGAPCRTSSDCSVATGNYCLGPVPPSCSCGNGSCTSDLQCAPDGGNRICQSFCGGACIQMCVPGCTDASCGEGTRCGVSHRCESKPCAGASDCPAQFDCVQSYCERRSCQQDGQCPGGYCVTGTCSSTIGVCQAGGA
jgi:hypothetical protein